MARIIVIEDDYRLANLLQRYLSFNKHQAFVAYNGVDGINLVRHERPDLVIIDLFLPDMTGEQLAHILRGTPQLAHLKLMLMSGSPEFLSPETPFAFDLIVNKPVSLVELSEAIGSLLVQQ